MSCRDFTARTPSTARSPWALLLAGLLVTGFWSTAPVVLRAEDASAAAINSILSGHAPSSLAELKAMQQRVRRLSERILPMTVAVQVGPAQGSGVIINPEGYVLTAAHVASQPGETAWLVLHDGRRVEGETLGVYRTLDAGLIRIIDPPRNGTWPHATMGDSAQVVAGQWCLAAGHPGGIQADRPAVIRLGRVLSILSNSTIKTDCTLIGGDSGGPLFDLKGRVIGVNSRIGNPLNVNLHVPVNTFRETWDRLAQGDEWGHLPGRQPFIGVQGKPDATDATISRVFPGTPAAEAGLEPGDLVLRFSGEPVRDFDDLQRLVTEHQPGQRVKIVVRRAGRQRTLELEIGERGG